jgi:hypothetical protein
MLQMASCSAQVEGHHTADGGAQDRPEAGTRHEHGTSTARARHEHGRGHGSCCGLSGRTSHGLKPPSTGRGAHIWDTEEEDGGCACHQKQQQTSPMRILSRLTVACRIGACCRCYRRSERHAAMHGWHPQRRRAETSQHLVDNITLSNAHLCLLACLPAGLLACWPAGLLARLPTCPLTWHMSCSAACHTGGHITRPPPCLRRCCGAADGRIDPLHGPDGGAVQDVRGAPGARLQRRPPAHRREVLHERRGDELRARGGSCCLKGGLANSMVAPMGRGGGPVETARVWSRGTTLLV